jgi:hypothetical protein
LTRRLNASHNARVFVGVLSVKRRKISHGCHALGLPAL